MSSGHFMVYWLTQNAFRGATVFLGLAIVAVTLYTYVHDYLMLTFRNRR